MRSKNHKATGRLAREQRQMHAQDSHEGRLLRDAAGQLRELDSRLGKGKGAKKERARLKKEMSNGKS